MTDLRRIISHNVQQVAIDSNLTGHGRRSFERMATDVVDRVQVKIIEAESGKAAAAVEADRARINTILSSPDARGREAAAVKLATSSDMTPEAAAEMLSGFPRHSGDPLGKYMSAAGTPGISSDCGDPDDLTEAEQAEAAANFIANAGKNS